MISKRLKNSCMTLNYVEHLITLTFAVTGCISISTFASLAVVPVGIVSSASGLNVCAITAEIEEYKSFIKREKEKHDKIVLLAKT